MVLELSKDPRMRRLMPFICMSGLMQGIPSLALYRITTRALPGETNVEINKKISLTMAVLGTLGVTSGQFLQKNLDKGKASSYMRFTSTLNLLALGFLLYLAYHPSFGLIFIVTRFGPSNC